MHQQTVVAAFKRPDEAQEALEALLDDGFPREKTHIGSAEGLDFDDVRTDQGSGSKHETLGEKIARFFGLGDDVEQTGSTYAEVIRGGNSVVVVDTVDEDEVQRASSILNRYDPIDIDARDSGPTATASSGSAMADREETRIPVVEEQIQVGKREVQSGGVRVFVRTTDVPVEQRVRLREERTTVTRRPADRPISESDRPFESTSFDVKETREEPVVGKTARVVEEVVVGKEARIREEAVQDRVRKTDVQVESLDDVSTNDRPRPRDPQER
jgi:stress response protein YsnF